MLTPHRQHQPQLLSLPPSRRLRLRVGSYPVRPRTTASRTTASLWAVLVLVCTRLTIRTSRPSRLLDTRSGPAARSSGSAGQEDAPW
jgi:hypothetical protein